MLVVPTTYQAERGVLLGALLAASIVYLLRFNRWRLHKEVALLGGLCITASLFFMLNGAYHSAPGALRVGSVYVVWPLLFLFFIGLLNRPDQLSPFLKVLVIAEVCAAIMGVMFVAEALDYLNFGISTLLEGSKASIGISDESIGYSLPNLSTVIYALPFLLGYLMLPRERTHLNGAWRLFVWFGLLLAVIVLLIAGRRAFWVIAAASPFVVFILAEQCKIHFDIKKLIVLATVILVGAVATIAIFDINIEVIWDDLVSGFEFSGAHDLSTHLRKEQYFSLLDGWMENPVLGAGLGSSASVIRNEELPWAYELTYLAILFQTGVLGIFVYGGAVVWIFARGIDVIRKQPESSGMLIPLLSGLVCFLIANATNPYLQKFDYLWTLFLPVAVLNAYLLNNNKLEFKLQ